ncbi:hypothetical protein MITS9509_01090 [Synechococcus sp. MIT S9509]|nr:hypothetical protein MITS9504_00655 [Synechococcus sp. MIT S9504]KZR92641.1 hypothetical protein MITS9509_01090 [Synechococcus sp. MIT S9509]
MDGKPFTRLGDASLVRHCEGDKVAGVTLNQQQAEKLYWSDLSHKSYGDLRQLLEEQDAWQYLSAIHPIVCKKLEACAAICICGEE